MKAYKPFSEASERQRISGVPLEYPWQVQDCDLNRKELLESEGFTVISDEEYQTLINSILITPVKKVPHEVTNQALRQALILKSFNDSKPELHPDAITAFVRLLPEPTRSIALNFWEFSNFMQRSNAVLNQLAPSLGLTSDQVDDLFIYASTLP